MLKSSTGWILIGLIFIAFMFLLVEVTAEVKEVKTLSELIESHVDLKEVTLSSNSVITDRNGDIISEIYRDANRVYLSYDQISPFIIDAFIATEDQRFFEHKGYDFIAITRAILSNARQESIEEGGSTMTQQLVRNLFLSHEQTYNRKMSEILYAHELEKTYSKNDIIELYINTVYFNNGVYGIEAASRYYFNKPSERLTLSEVAFLSAVPNNPSHYDPLTNSDRTKLRQEWVLKKMLEARYISEDEYQDALVDPIQLNVRKKIDTHPDYVTYIHQEFIDLVAESEGYNLKIKQAPSDEAKQKIEQNLQERVQHLLAQGIEIETYLDPFMQNLAIKTIHRQVPDTDIQATAVVIDHVNNELIAMTAGKDYRKFDLHRGYQVHRQTASAIKPLLVYAPYFEEYNVPIQSTINADNICYKEKGEEYCPRNYGGAQYGMVSLATALKHSYNTPAIRILDRVGVETAFSYLDAFDFSKVDASEQRLTSALGGFTHGVTPLELTRAYTTFARNGSYQTAYGIKQVLDKNGQVLFAWEPEEMEVWSKATNDKMRKLLSEVIESGTARKAQIPADYAGGKTGTSSDYLDLWFVGLNDRYTTGVWVGKDQWLSIAHLSDQSPHLQIWKEIMK
ncbi:transglycosylase domain-containing protein [Halalkalibacter akibai]|uniref:Multimodular transpeptidase-transglycosylase n=1 Tax=Halalkalibacter akibai (strain ATCC 43226 / DSM 21942 / CIP 109018 / JCM 9157 / 1139) TaxID=1236973 RepID=W4R1S2_HALA3|nr:transglycosylase domain-containing protein [Halalkalibacter akibai]GAE37479.1 multimodular transpeptidase-transglycosylase [Halalkalibacter akibai JCM 9157]